MKLFPIAISYFALLTQHICHLNTSLSDYLESLSKQGNQVLLWVYIY